VIPSKYIFNTILVSLALGILLTGCVFDIAPKAFNSDISSTDTQTFQNDNELKDQTYQTPESESSSSGEVSSANTSSSTSIDISHSSSKEISKAYSKTQTRPTAVKAKPAPTKVPAKTSYAVKLAIECTSSIVLDSMIGSTKDQIISKYGQPLSCEMSEYGFTWYVYHNGYKRFFMVGIRGETVVGAYSNSSNLFFSYMPSVKTRSNIRKSMSSKYGKPLSSIQKGNMRYIISNQDQKDVFYDGKKYLTVFYDNTKGGVLTSVMIISKSTEQAFGYFPAPSEELDSSFERVSFYLVNSIRVRSGLKALTIDLRLQKLAIAHSVDMVKRSYFSHTNPEGQSSSDRLRNAGISFRKCSENISKNYPSSIFSHEGYMNSEGHRKNILGDYKYIGIGAEIASGKILQTQIFIA